MDKNERRNGMLNLQPQQRNGRHPSIPGAPFSRWQLATSRNVVTDCAHLSHSTPHCPSSDIWLRSAGQGMPAH
eukprot:3665671-Amphidinium_carterae.1